LIFPGQDRIRAIAKGLNLTTVLWGYDSNDWQNGFGGVTDQDVDNYYQYFVNNATSGTFNTVSNSFLLGIFCSAERFKKSQH